ncbi:MAG: exonuclease SbcCD subunit D [Oscillospiraceae bacterium]|nr:exonuclease SbcCD subunit D [Oscillospiraceae bacterium]
MKLMHLSDIHLGKRLNDFSLLEDQQYILRKILEIIDAESPQCVILAGDIYDKSVPPAEAVTLFDRFLSAISKRSIPVLMISGNHDSAERIAFASGILQQSGIHISPVYNGTLEPVTLSDEWGTVQFYLLPFIRPSAVRRFFPEQEITSYTDAVNAAVDALHLDTTRRNVIVTHQFVTGASCCDSEEHIVGGTENVDASAFDGFDYVALGHIHNPQNIGSERIRYCGTPLKYSLSEAKHRKTVTIAELKEKGSLTIREIPLTPLRDVREISGTFAEMMAGEKSDDLISVVLTDEDEIPDAVYKLRTVYPNILQVRYDNKRSRFRTDFTDVTASEEQSPLELFASLYALQNNDEMTDEKKEYIRRLMETIEGEEA